MSTIEVQNFKKHFGRTKAVDGISFEVEKGEIFGFLGPNGAGKTTTIRCIMDFIRPTSGQISILGQDSQKNSVDLKSKIGYLSPEVKLYENWNGAEHIEFIEKIRGKSKIAENLINQFDFDRHAKVRYLSSGNKKKLSLILAFMSEPEVLILDEPTVGLDPILQNAIYKILREFQKKGCTIFMSSHNLPEVERICGRAGIIRQGKMVAIEDIQTLKEKKIHIVYAYFNQEFQKSDFKFDGVAIAEEMPDTLVLNVKGDINPLMKKLGQYKLKDIEITHATLEDVFLEFYQRG